MKRTTAGLAALALACTFLTQVAEAGPAKGKPQRSKSTPAKTAKRTSSPAPAPAPSPVARPAETSSASTPSGSLLPACPRSGPKDPRCGRVMWGSGGTLGSGPAIYGTSGFPSVGDGFIDGNRLVVAVEMGAQLDDQGVVMGIDLTTGDRTILSGKVEDPAKGPVVVGSGPDLGGIRSVTQAGSAWMALASTGARQPVSVIRIDPKTGTRTLERKIEKGLTCTGNGTKLFVDFDGGIAAGADGTVYVAAGNPGSKLVGIVALKGNSCDVVTMSGGGGSDSKGAGPTVESMDGYRALKLDGGKLWALHGMTNSLFTIDILTGNRARVSSGEPSTKVGAGEKLGYQRIALAGSRIWTAGPWAGNGFVLTEASASNGQRTGRDATSGPASYGDEPKGVWVHPTKPLLVLSIDKAFVFFDPATGQSSTFSQ